MIILYCCSSAQAYSRRGWIHATQLVATFQIVVAASASRQRIRSSSEIILAVPRTRGSNRCSASGPRPLAVTVALPRLLAAEANVILVSPSVSSRWRNLLKSEALRFRRRRTHRRRGRLTGGDRLILHICHLRLRPSFHLRRSSHSSAPLPPPLPPLPRTLSKLFSPSAEEIQIRPLLSSREGATPFLVRLVSLTQTSIIS